MDFVSDQSSLSILLIVTLSVKCSVVYGFHTPRCRLLLLYCNSGAWCMESIHHAPHLTIHVKSWYTLLNYHRVEIWPETFSGISIVLWCYYWIDLIALNYLQIRDVKGESKMMAGDVVQLITPVSMVRGTVTLTLSVPWDSGVVTTTVNTLLHTSIPRMTAATILIWRNQTLSMVEINKQKFSLFWYFCSLEWGPWLSWSSTGGGVTTRFRNSIKKGD